MLIVVNKQNQITIIIAKIVLRKSVPTTVIHRQGRSQVILDVEEVNLCPENVYPSYPISIISRQQHQQSIVLLLHHLHLHPHQFDPLMPLAIIIIIIGKQTPSYQNNQPQQHRLFDKIQYYLLQLVFQNLIQLVNQIQSLLLIFFRIVVRRAYHHLLFHLPLVHHHQNFPLPILVTQQIFSELYLIIITTTIIISHLHYHHHQLLLSFVANIRQDVQFKPITI